MGKSKKPARQRPRGTNNLPKEVRSNCRTLIGAATTFIGGIGWGIMGFSNQSLACIILGLAAILGWLYVCVWRCPKKLKRFVPPALFLGLAAIVLGSLLGAIYMERRREPSNTEVVRTINDANDNLMAALRSTLNSEEDRLKRDYPLGYIMIALSGHRKGIIPRPNDIEADWNGMTVSLDAEGDSIGVQIPFLLDKRTHIQLRACGIWADAVPGAHSEMGLGSSNEVWMKLECLEAKPVGLFAVLGFKEGVDTKAGKEQQK